MNSSVDDLRSNIELACQSQNVGRILQGRSQVLAMPRAWVLEHIEKVATGSLDLSDYWEYRRLLELAELLDSSLLDRFVLLGIDNPDSELREAAEDYI